MRLDLASGKFELIDPFKYLAKGNHSPYGLAADAANNLYFMDFGENRSGRWTPRPANPPSIRRPPNDRGRAAR